MKKTFLFISYLIFSVLLLILCTEGLGRLVIHWRYGVPGKSYGLWQYDPELGATYRPNSYNTLTSLNNYGFRNSREDVFESKPSNSLRIIAIGASTTFGYNLVDEDTFTWKLEQKFRKIPGLERTQVLNAGQICHSTGHNLIRIKRLVPKLKPDYVILYEGLNELLNAWVLRSDGVSFSHLYETKTYGVLGKSYGQNHWLERNSVIARFLNYCVQNVISTVRKNEIIRKEYDAPALEAQNREIKRVAKEPWVAENFKFLFRQMIDFLLSEGVTPIVIRPASVNSPEALTFSDIALEIAREKGVPICDMRSRFERVGNMNDLFIHTGIHVTPKGAELLADELFQTISKDLKAKENNK